MNIAGLANSTLSERLSAKLAEDRKQIEELTLNEHKKLAQSFLDASSAEFSIIQNAMHEQRLSTVKTLRGILHWPLWIAFGCMVIVLTALALLWAGTWWMRQDLSDLRAATKAEQEAFGQLQSQTGGIRIVTSEKGMFLVLRKDAESGWTCTDQKLPCIRLQAGGW